MMSDIPGLSDADPISYGRSNGCLNDSESEHSVQCKFQGY